MTAILAMSFIALLTAPPAAGAGGTRLQQCLHGADAAPEQKARRTQAVGAMRAVNNMQANQPASRANKYLRHEDLAGSPFAQKQTGGPFKSLNLTPGQEIVPGWELTLDVMEDGYWFMIKDKTDPCGFTLISNQTGLIYTAEPLR
jgi:hypothetical protein